ncbi:hypothetical protein ACHAWF_005784 [Thalassiosira exigua]
MIAEGSEEIERIFTTGLLVCGGVVSIPGSENAGRAPAHAPVTSREGLTPPLRDIHRSDQQGEAYIVQNTFDGLPARLQIRSRHCLSPEVYASVQYVL